MPWQKVSLIGVGLLGGSLGLALKQRKLARTIVGFVRRGEYISACRKKGAIDEGTLDLDAAVRDADLVILCTHLGSMRDLVSQMLPSLKPGAILTDVGSVKGPFLSDLEQLARKARSHFIGSHPMAGSEKTGVNAAKADLFENRICVVTPTDRSDAKALKKIEGLWRSVGAIPLRLEADLHDQIAGRASHLTHVVAAELVNSVLTGEHINATAQLCGKGFFDTTTRIASGSPEMWRDISFFNKKHLLAALHRFVRGLRQFETDLKRGNHEAVLNFFASAAGRRRQCEVLFSKQKSRRKR